MTPKTRKFNYINVVYQITFLVETVKNVTWAKLEEPLERHKELTSLAIKKHTDTTNHEKPQDRLGLC